MISDVSTVKTMLRQALEASKYYLFPGEPEMPDDGDEECMGSEITLDMNVLAQKVAAHFFDEVCCREFMRNNGMLPEERMSLHRHIDELRAKVISLGGTFDDE